MTQNLETASAVKTGSLPQPFVAYPDHFSVRQGDDVQFRFAGELLSSGGSIASIEIFDGHTHQSQSLIKFEEHAHPLKREACHSWYAGCKFSQFISVTTASLPPGLYYAFLSDFQGVQATPVYFHVRPTAEQVRAADVVILLSEPTWHAYNFYAGGSLYGIHRTDELGAVTIKQNLSSRLYAASMQRPLLVDPSGLRPEFRSVKEVLGFFQDPSHANLGIPSFDPERNTSWMRTAPESNIIFSQFLRDSNLSTVTVAMTDLEAEPTLLSEQAILLISGHNEYWTETMITAVEDFVSRGGRIANFSGNVMWWKIILSEGTIFQDQVGHDRSARCGEIMPSEFRGTGYLHLLAKTAPEKIFGVNYRFANFPLNYTDIYSDAELQEIYGVSRTEIDLSKTQGITVTASDHPIFEGLSLKKGAMLAADVSLLAVELDGAPLSPDRTLDRTLANDFPSDTRILGTGFAFVATSLRFPDGLNNYIGPKEVGLIVETVPDPVSGARTISVGSIGVYNGLAINDPQTERLVLNAVKYLQHSQP